MFKRKIYDEILKWKSTSKGKTLLLIEGARRIGKSTIEEAFAKNEYSSYILIDFTFSLISINKNVKDILIPSEERKISMYPMDFEDFLWALGDTATIPIL